MSPRPTQHIPFRFPAWRRAGAFSLVELLVASALLLTIVGILVTMVNMTTFLWNSTTGGVQDFQRARQAFDILTTRLSQATLNTYWDYRHDANGDPVEYVRQSELRFINDQAATLTGTTTSIHPGKAVFFQAPGGTCLSGSLALPGALSTWGYFVEYGSDSSYLPDFFAGKIPERYRFRLIELMEPSDQLTIYNYTSGIVNNQPKNLTYTGWEWFTTPLAAVPSRKRIVAENVVALVLLPKLSPNENTPGNTLPLLAPKYKYDSSPLAVSGTNALLDPTNQLPPLVDVSMIVVDERSVARQSWTSTPPDLGFDKLFLDATQQAYDLNTLEAGLRKLGLHPRRFTVTVAIRGAKWSTNQ